MTFWLLVQMLYHQGTGARSRLVRAAKATYFIVVDNCTVTM